MPLLGAALIVRDEERELPLCLESLAGWVDEIVVVDTGSRDRTRELAAAAGARLFDFPWRGDFAAARNCALSHMTSEWALNIDADERALPGCGAPVRRQLSAPGSDAMGQRLRLHPGSGQDWHWALRLVRCGRGLEYTGLIHESLWPAIVTACGVVDDSPLELTHTGYDGDSAAKNARDLPLLEAELRRDPSRVNCWCHLAEIRFRQGNLNAASAAWSEALRQVRLRPTPRPDDLFAFVGALRDPLDDTLLREAETRFPQAPQIIFLRARWLIEQGEYASALAALDRLAGLPSGGEHIVAADLRLAGEWAWAARALCHFRMRQFAESRACYAEAAALAPEQMEYRVKQALCKRLETGA
jgi:glycosyltransferase involved in cell wall biosynthesis